MSDTYSIQVIGLEELKRRFGSITPLIHKELYRAMYRAVQGELQRMPPYPPPPSTSTYRRTGLLGRSLSGFMGTANQAASAVEDLGMGNVRGIVGTAVEYAPAVIGRMQAMPHRGRWWQLPSVVMSHQSQIQKEFNAVPERIAEALGD